MEADNLNCLTRQRDVVEITVSQIENVAKLQENNALKIERILIGCFNSID